MTLAAVALTVILGLVVNELTDISPWAARRLVGWSARLRYENAVAEMRAEELSALINERPGKLLKVGTALAFVAAAVTRRIRRRVTGRDESNQPSRISLDGLRAARRLRPLEDEPSRLLARYLFPTERFRGEWRRHWFLLVTELICGAGLGVLVWQVGELSFEPGRYGLAGRDLIFSPSTGQIITGTAVWACWRLLMWRNGRFALTNKRLMVIKGLFVRRVAMHPLANAGDLGYRRWLLGRVFGYGTLTLRSVSIFNPLRRVRYLPHSEEIHLRAVEEMYEPAAVEARMGGYWEGEPEESQETDSKAKATEGGSGPAAWTPPTRPRLFAEWERELEERMRDKVVFVLAAAMTTDVWSLVRDTVSQAMQVQGLGVADQLDSEARKLARVATSKRQEHQRAVAEKWRQRLTVLCSLAQTDQLMIVAGGICRCLPRDSQEWVEANLASAPEMRRREVQARIARQRGEILTPRYKPDSSLPDEPAEQVVEYEQAELVRRMTADVLVVRGRPRYHLPGCVHLLGRESVPLPVGTAIETGHTPCCLCEPNNALLVDEDPLGVRSGLPDAMKERGLRSS